MKISIFLIFLIFLFFSCKKNPNTQQLRFGIINSDVTTPINYDSIDYTAVSYVDVSIPNDTHSVNMNIRTEYLNLRSGHPYFFTRFDMVGKSGKVMYYIPQRTDTSAGNILPKLPIYFRIPEDGGVSLGLTVVRFKD